MAAYDQVYGQAQGVANAPLNLYNIGPNASNLVAPLTRGQRLANTQILNQAQFAQNDPYVAQAGSEINNILANPIGTGIPTFNTSGLPTSGLSAYGTAQLLGTAAAGYGTQMPGAVSPYAAETNALAMGLPGAVSPYAAETNALAMGLPGAVSPYVGQSAGLAATLPGAAESGIGAAQRAGSAITGGGIQNYGALGEYLSPYTQQVTGALQRQFNQQNAQQQSEVAGNAAAQGAWGGDRSAVAAALTAGQQQLAEAPELANVEQQGFQQAQQTLSQQQQLQLSELGTAGQLGLGTAGATTSAYGTAGQLGLGAAGATTSAYGTAGQLGLGAAGATTSAYGTAGQLGLGAGQLGLSGLTGAAQTELAATQPQLAAAQGELGEYNAEQQLQLGEQQAQGWLGEGAAYALGNLGQEQQGLALQGAQALEGVGAQTQAEHQAQLNVPYEQFEQQQAYPFQTTGWLGNIAEGLGGQMGGTASTQYPPPSALSQIAGAGLTGAGLIGMTGGFGSNGWLTSGLSGLFGGGADLAGSAALGGELAATAPALAGGAFSLGSAAAASPWLAFAAKGGRIARRAAGGTLDYPGYRSAPQPLQPATGPQVPNPAEPFIGSAPLSIHPGMGPPRPPSGGLTPPGQQNPATQGMQTALQAAQIRRLLGGAPAAGGSFAFGGAGPAGLSEPLRLDLGGSALMRSGEAMEGGQGPGQGGLITAALTRQFAQLPTERLHELSVGIPPFSPQGIAIQRALQIHTMNAGAGIAAFPGAPMTPAPPTASPGLAAPAQPAMPGVRGIGADRGGRMRVADGGFPAAGPVTDMKGNIIGRVSGPGAPAPLHLQDGGDADEGEAGGVIALPPIDVTAPAPPGFHNPAPDAGAPGAKPGLVPDSGLSPTAALPPPPPLSADVPRPAEKPLVPAPLPSSTEPPSAGGTLGAPASTLPAPTSSKPQSAPAAAAHPSLASAPPPGFGGPEPAFPPPPSEFGGRNTDPRGVAPIIAADAQKYGISPDIALRVFSHEGMQSYVGDNGTSFGAPQLHVTPGGNGDAVGDLFVRQTGLDPRDPKNEPAMIDFALKYASQHGWGAWTGARVAGVKPWEGIGNHQGLGATPPLAAGNPPTYTVLPTTLDTPPIGEPSPGAGADTGGGLGTGWRDYEKAITNLVNNARRETAGERAMASPWMGVLSAGLGMLSSRSPYPGVAIGEGGLKGLQTWEQAQGAVPKIQLERAEAAQRQLPLLEAPFNIGLITSMMRPSGAPQRTNASAGTPAAPVSPATMPSPVGSPAAAAALASETGAGRQRQPSGAAPPAPQTLPGGTPIPIGFGQDSRFAQYDEGYRTADTLRQQAAQNLAQLDAPATKAWYLIQGKFDQWQQRRQGWLTQENDALSRQTSLMQQDPRWAATRAGMEAQARLGPAIAQAGGEAAARFPYQFNQVRPGSAGLLGGKPVVVVPQPREYVNPVTGEKYWGSWTPPVQAVPSTGTSSASAPPSSPSATTAAHPAAAQAPSPPTAAGLPPGMEGVAGLGPGQEEALRERALQVQKDRQSTIDNAASAQTNQTVLNEMESDAQNFQTGPFASHVYAAEKYLRLLDPKFNQPVASYEDFIKELGIITRTTVRQVSSRAAVQEFNLIQQSLPNPEMSPLGLQQVTGELKGLNDYSIAKLVAQNQWEATHQGNLDNFEATFEQNISPYPFLVNRLPSSIKQNLFSHLAQTSEGRRELQLLRQQMQMIDESGLSMGAQ